MILFEDLSYRQIFLDGRELPRDPNPNWMGYSVGHWEGERSSSRRPASTIGRGSTSPAIRTARRCG